MSDEMRKIKALLAKAESTTPEEAEALRDKAYELMAKWNIDEAALEAQSGEATDEIDTIDLELKLSPYQAPLEELLGYLCRLNNIEWMYYQENRKRRYTLVGFRRDLDLVQTLWTSLMLQAAREFQSDETQVRMDEEMRIAGITGLQRGAKVIQWRNTFQTGFNSGVYRQLKKAKKTAESGIREAAALLRDTDPPEEVEQLAKSTALVLKSKEIAVKETFKKRFPDLTKGKGSQRETQHGSAAHSLGVAAGTRASTGTGAAIGGARRNELT